MIKDFLTDKLAFAVAIRRQYHLIRTRQRGLDGFELGRLVAVTGRACRVQAFWFQKNAVPALPVWIDLIGLPASRLQMITEDIMTEVSAYTLILLCHE